MIRLVLLLIALLTFVAIAVALVVGALLFIALACAVGLPLWYIGRQMARKHNLTAPMQRPIERLQNLYIDGKIDLFEFERRVAQLIPFEK